MARIRTTKPSFWGSGTIAKLTRDARLTALGLISFADDAVRGKPKPLVRNVPTWLSAPPSRHSEKPEAAMRIFENYIDGPRLELFARRKREGWTSWGNEIKGAA